MNSISIVLCTCNGERFLDEQLTTLREQEGVDEIFVADDQSEDDTMAILHQHALADPRIRISRSERRLGVTQNFQRALRLARGKWLALADQDDIWLPKKIATLRAAWDGEAVLVHHATHKFSGRPPRVLPSPAGESRKFFGNDVRRLLYRNTVVGHTTVIRADVARQLMPFPTAVPYDWWLGAGATLYGKIQYVDEYLVHYRIHNRNAYHPSGSRISRLCAEQELRLNLLRELEHAPRLSTSARDFIRVFQRELSAAGTTRVPWRLGQFYLQHAPLFFAGPNRQLSRWKRWRKSITATFGSMAPHTVNRAQQTQARPAGISTRSSAVWWSLGVGVVSAASLLAMWPGRTHNGQPASANPAATLPVATRSGSSESAAPPSLYLLRHDRYSGADDRLIVRFERRPRQFHLPPSLGFGLAVRPRLAKGPVVISRLGIALRYFRTADRAWPGRFHPALLQRNLRRLPFGPPRPGGIPYFALVRRPLRI